MSWNGIALATSDVLGISLVIRLLSLRLHRVYRVFCAYLLFALLCSSIFFIDLYVVSFDYRLTYLTAALGTWVLTLWMVYALLEAILARLPGILRFSRKLLIAVFVIALVLALAAARSEFLLYQSFHAGKPLSLAVHLVSVVERVVTTVSMVALLAIQAFVLWFPVQLPRNLVLFSIGFVFNFVCETALLVLRGLLPQSAATVIDPVNLFVLSACYAYFALVITPSGETTPLRLGHRWHRAEQERLVHQLEEINGVLLKSVRH